MGELYLHQKEAIHQQQQYPKCLINMWCGTGKTRTFTVDLLDDCKKMNVIVFPSLGLINQYCNDYALSSEEPFKSGFDKFKCLSFCSDNDGKLKSKGKIIFTTDEDKLKTFVKKTDNKKLVLVTYHSFEKFINICILEKINIGKLIFDEAHHIVGDKIQNIVFNNQELDNIVEQTRYYTATPVNKNGITMYDRDDPENSDCGPLAYEYLYYQAIEDKVCKPFETQISLYTQKPEYKNKYQPVFESIIRACLSGKYDYWNILTYHSLVNESEDMSDTISFVKDFASKKNQTLVKKLFTKIQNEEFPHTKVVYSVDNVILKGLYTGTKNINIILEDFDQKVPGRIYILSSCGMLNEGIDTKWANMGVPINPTKSIVKESQRIGRLVRLPEKDMPPAIILIPCEVDIAKYYSLDTPEKRDQMIREELSECGNFNTALNVISAFKYQYDPDLFEMCLRYPNMYAPKEVKDNLEKQGLIVEESQGNLLDNLKYVCEKERIELDIDGDGIGNKELLKLVAEKCDKTIEIHTQNHDEPIKYVNEESMDEEPLRLFYCEDDKTYSPIVKKDKKQTIKRKSTEPPKKRPKLFDVHMHPDLEVIWKIKESSIDFDKAFSQGVLEVDINWNVKKWYKSLENVMMYMDTNDKKPSYNDKNSETQKLGTWIGTQLTNYKTKKQIMEKENIRKSWESFVTDDKYSIYFEDNDTLWYKTLEKVKMYIDANKKRPSKGSKDTDTKQLASWIGNQLTNYKTKKDIMKNENIVKSWESFVTDDKYSEYFEDKDTLWYKSLDKVKLYIDTNKKRPSTTDKDTDAKQLAKWISHQLTNYKTKKDIMKNENIVKSWESFVTDDKYSEYFEDKDTLWYKSLDKVKLYIDTNKKRPPDSSKDTDTKQLGKWISHQLTNYKTKQYIMSNNENIRKSWELFVTDDKYSKYFEDPDTFWYGNLEKVKLYIDTNKKRPPDSSKDTDTKQLHGWIGTQQHNYKTKQYIMSNNENIRKSWELFVTDDKYSKYFEDPDTLWYGNLEKVKLYIDTNKKRPSHGSKDTDTKQLGGWIGTQLTNYKTKKQIMSNNENIRKSWELFVTDDKYSKYFEDPDTLWYGNLEKVKLYIDTNKKRPPQCDKDTDIKQLGGWIGHQQTNYKTKKEIMKNENIVKSWESFVTDDKYSEYFEDKDTLWYKMWYKSLDKVKLYIDTNKKRPSKSATDAKQLEKWISHQLTNYKTKKYSMKNENIRKSWESFVTDDKYSMYFEKYIKENELVKKPPTKKDMSKPIIIPKKSSLEIKAERQQRAKSEISVLHQKYKTMTSQNLNTLFKENPEKWDEYHKISKDNEESFPEDEIPRNKMIKYLENIPGKKQKDIADLGCGFAEINQHFVNNSRFTFHNFDHHSSGELVVERDIKDTGLDDYDIDVVILSLAMWGSNCEDYLKEAHRILDTGGILLIAEPYKRWNKEVDEAEKPINRLVKLLEENEFINKKIEEEKFMFIVCVKL